MCHGVWILYDRLNLTPANFSTPQWQQPFLLKIKPSLDLNESFIIQCYDIGMYAKNLQRKIVLRLGWNFYDKKMQ